MTTGQTRLSARMTVEKFDAAYFYAAELKSFAHEIGIPVGNFRKTELEALIRQFLETGKVPSAKPVLPRRAGAPRDMLAADTPVVNYVGDKRTKSFLMELVHARDPAARNKSGQWYWLNDWRRQQQEGRAAFTYADLADKLLELMTTTGRLPQIPSARFNNFITDFLADPQNAGAGRRRALEAWEFVKSRKGAKTYQEYKRLKDATN